MGYTTDFDGEVSIDPPLNAEEISFLRKFNNTRRMAREKGPYYVDGSGMCGQDRESDITDYNSPPRGQPGLWCQWIPSDDGTIIVWDGGEKFYNAEEWMEYIIDHFLAPNAKAKKQLPFLQANHTVNGTIHAQGEERGDIWAIVVTDNIVRRKQGRISYEYDE